MTNEQKLREFVSKYVNDDNEPTFLSDLTALISEHYYPKEFLLWVVIQDYWGMDILTCKWTNDEPKAFQEELTTDELFNYWKENEQC